ncbi:hypothetical protein MNBD_GAMMA09-2631 [hydrothermal vent metagenome]|uniref:PD-(D/E)XK endonuclease-like domain-containing protein n=1 Tax=hydrothermal vent metagenome TaxID=652676 RepID=A0A3B0XVU1_9ZZZZ
MLMCRSMTSSATAFKRFSIPTNQPFTDALARYILSEHKNDLPDLSNIQILLPNAQAAQQMRYSLCKQASTSTGTALIGGYTGSLEQWLKQHITASTNSHEKNEYTSKKQISQASRQLILLNELKQHPDLFPVENHWQICDSLLELFDELSLSQHQWLNESTPVWVKHLQQAYQTNEDISHLNHEAKIVQTLWLAWQQQLDAMEIDDESTALKHRLLSSFNSDLKNAYFYIAGIEQLSPLEQSWCEQLSQFADVTHIIQGDLPADKNSTVNEKSPLTENKTKENELQLLHDIYTQSSSLFERTQNYKTTDNPYFLTNIKTFDAQSAEQETHAVDLKIRMSLLNGKNNIAVVTENRKLARRLRALLERANVDIQDTAGWALATTSAASVLERWLECIEQNFAYQPFIDLLKSPFFCDEDKLGEHLNLVYRFEQDIILHENIASDLRRYKTAIESRRERLNIDTNNVSERLTQLLNKVEKASHELLELFLSGQKKTSSNWIDAFINSLQNLGIYPRLAYDIAGLRVQQELTGLSATYSIVSPQMSWQDFRTWLGSTLEREQFRPHDQVSSVKIMNLQQAQYCRFDTLIIAGANAESLPGKAGNHAFFNQTVRQALHFKNWPEKKAYSFYQFRQILLSSDDILITWQAEKKGEWMPPSPWVSSLENFSQHAFKQSLKDRQLNYLLKQIKPVTEKSESLLANINTVSQAFPLPQKELIPAEFSASRHQRLIDCPYKFFASDVLRLRVLEQISLELMKSEYGEKVHLILYAFHQQAPGLPAPFKPALTNENRSLALAHIQRLSKQIFSAQIEDSIQHRGWLTRWLDTAEAYIDWQIQRQMEWHIYKLELTTEKQLATEAKLTGRLDRVDKQGSRVSIIDYKTGTPAKQQDIDLAENIQLSSYAALMDEVKNVIYLKLDKGTAKQSGFIEGDDLNTLKTDVLQRLESLISDITSSAALPAWGDTQSCSYCDMSGLCRKQMWEING